MGYPYEEEMIAVGFNGTLSREFWNLMLSDSIKLDHCAVCGATGHLEHHHMVPRSAGNLYYKGATKINKPTITLCGFGNTAGCHGLAHAHKLFFRKNPIDGEIEFTITEKPCKYYKIVDVDEIWKKLNV